MPASYLPWREGGAKRRKGDVEDGLPFVFGIPFRPSGTFPLRRSKITTARRGSWCGAQGFPAPRTRPSAIDADLAGDQRRDVDLALGDQMQRAGELVGRVAQRIARSALADIEHQLSPGGLHADATTTMRAPRGAPSKICCSTPGADAFEGQRRPGQRLAAHDRCAGFASGGSAACSVSLVGRALRIDGDVARLLPRAASESSPPRRSGRSSSASAPRSPPGPPARSRSPAAPPRR